MKLLKNFQLNPVTARRLRRFRQMKRGWWSLWILLFAYVISLGSELIANDKPYFVQYEGKWYFPIVRYYSDDAFTGSGYETRADYKKINQGEAFQSNPDNFMVFPPHPYGPYEILDPADIDVKPEVTVQIQPMPRVGSIYFDADLKIVGSRGAEVFFGKGADEMEGLDFGAFFKTDDTLRREVKKRLENVASDGYEASLKSRSDEDGVADVIELSMSPYRERSRAPSRVRVTLRDAQGDDTLSTEQFIVGPAGEIVEGESPVFASAGDEEREAIINLAKERFVNPVASQSMMLNGEAWRVSFNKTDVRWPFQPTGQHPFGVDEAGRDVLSRILYGLRISMSFGLLLVVSTMIIGIIIGAVQGYFGGFVDISTQRLIEIWSSLPFLFIMILLGSVFGRGFFLLLLVYGIFNWIGISYYMRAEFFRLRRQQFVEAARCLGVPTWKILLKHIFPNALVPIITFFPFSLVGAIGSLAALDYLGFGMPPPTASWGELLNQAQTVRWAWWLILFPSLSLFIVILLGVFIGEGVRNAWDPRDYSGVQ